MMINYLLQSCALLHLSALVGTANLVPYGPGAGDTPIPKQTTGNDDGAQEVPFPLTYLGRKFRTIHISGDGYLSFGGAASMRNLGTPWSFPVPSQPGVYDRALLVPYLSHTLLADDDVGNVFYRRQDKYSQQGRDLLTSLNGLVRQSVLGYDAYTAHSVLVVTWSNMTFEGYLCQNNKSSCPPRNTFQAVVMTDGSDSMVVLNYGHLLWLAGPQHGGSPVSGSTERYFPLAGFNAGSGHGWTALPLSSSPDVWLLWRYETGLEPGQFVYHVSDEQPTPGGCQTESTQASLQIFPGHGTFHGGTLLTLAGPCFTARNQSLIKCKFLDTIVDGRLAGDRRVECLVPFLGRLGFVDVSLSVDGGRSFPYSANYYLVNREAVQLSSPASWLQIDPGQLELTWNPSDLSSDVTIPLDIELYGLNSTRENKFVRLRKLGQQVANSGKFVFRPESVKCTITICSDYVTGLVKIVRSGDDGGSATSPHIWSRSTSILWYSYTANILQYGEPWAHQKCDLWYQSEKLTATWRAGLNKCPCLLEQALTDFRFRSQPDCNMYGDSSCVRHRGARHCVLSQISSASGAGSQCCYGNDNLLMHSFDTKYAGFSHRTSPLGAAPYTVTQYPGIGHMLTDIEPYNLCCLWSEISCDKYVDVRPTQDCHGYTAAKLAFVYGDPHVITFGGRAYTFNGRGEFLLLQSSLHNIVIQGRFEQVQNQPVNPANGTVLTSVALRANDSAVIELTVNRADWSWRRQITVMVNGVDMTDFHDWSSRQQYKGCVITSNPTGLDSPQSNFTVLFNSGLGVNVAASSNILRLVVSTPEDVFRGATTGLLGAWGDDVVDTRTRDGAPYVMTESAENLHKQFGLNWMIAKKESLFTYKYGTDYESYSDVNFSPNFSVFARQKRSLRRLTANVARRKRSVVDLSAVRAGVSARVCGGNKECEFDYLTTGNEHLSAETKQFGDTAKRLKADTKQVPFCPAFHVPYAVKSTHNYSLGQTVTITACDIINGEYTMAGTLNYKCILGADLTAQWDYPIDAYCYPFPTKAVIIGTGGGILILMLVAVLIAGYFMYPKLRSIGESRPWRDLTERELQLERRRSARTSHFILKNRGSLMDNEHETESPRNPFERLRRSIRRKSSMKPMARISPTHQLAVVSEQNEENDVAADKTDVNHDVVLRFSPRASPYPSEIASGVYFDCRSRADTDSFVDCLSDYPDSLVSDDTFYDADRESPRNWNNSYERSPRQGRPSRQLGNVSQGILSWPAAESDDHRPIHDNISKPKYDNDMDII